MDFEKSRRHHAVKLVPSLTRRAAKRWPRVLDGGRHRCYLQDRTPGVRRPLPSPSRSVHPTRALLGARWSNAIKMAVAFAEAEIGGGSQPGALIVSVAGLLGETR